jgi:hypothetical protein
MVILVMMVILMFSLVGISLCCVCAMSVCKDVSGSNS